MRNGSTASHIVALKSHEGLATNNIDAVNVEVASRSTIIWLSFSTCTCYAQPLHGLPHLSIVVRASDDHETELVITLIG